MCLLPAEELLSLLGSGLVGVADEDLDEALGASGHGQAIGEEGEESGGGRESRVSLYEFGNPLMQVSPTSSCRDNYPQRGICYFLSHYRVKYVRWSASETERQVGGPHQVLPLYQGTEVLLSPCPLLGVTLGRQRERSEGVGVGFLLGPSCPHPLVGVGLTVARRRRGRVVHCSMMGGQNGGEDPRYVMVRSS